MCHFRVKLLQGMAYIYLYISLPTDWDTDVMVGTGAVTLGPELKLYIEVVRALKSNPKL